jgi:hypothetical protein
MSVIKLENLGGEGRYRAETMMVGSSVADSERLVEGACYA